MNILVVGRGGREHSIIMKIAEDKRIKTIFAAPGNGGTAEIATNVAIDEMDIDGLIKFVKENQVALTIIGPEAPLNEGIANRFEAEGLAVFAPTKEAALLEGSKSFAKDFMKKYDIPTAYYAIFSDVDKAKAYIEEKGAPIVIKADGLAAGKGVVVAETKAEAFAAVEDMLVSKAFAEAGATVVIEEFLAGKEFSLMAFVHGNNVFPMITARDHKRAYDGDLGPNTGGMGAYAPVPDVTEAAYTFSVEEVVQKAADSMVLEGRSFTGILYAGLMMTEEGPKVIEFNTRFGDPETQVILPLLKNEFVQVIEDVLAGNDPQLQWEDNFCVGVVVASKGYPGSYEKHIPIPVLETDVNTFVVHAGTKNIDDKLVSDGGRVLFAGAKADTFSEARDAAYNVLKPFVGHDGFFYRNDIGKQS